MLRDLIYHWRANLAVALAAAVATAVLLGALLIGDSLEASLRSLTLDRLGLIDYAVTSQGFVGEELAADAVSAAGEAGLSVEAAPIIALRGSAVAPDSGSRAANVALYGVDADFFRLAAPDDPDLIERLGRQPGQLFPSIVVNESLGRELGVGIGDSVVLSFERASDVPRESLLGERDEVLGSLRLAVTAVVADRGVGRFGLTTTQATPLNAFVPRPELARRVRQPGKANALVFEASPEATTDEVADSAIEAALRGALTLEDLGLEIERSAAELIVESREFVLRQPTADAIERLAAEAGAATLPSLTYLANSLTVGERAVPYSTLAALPMPTPPGFAGLELVGGGPARAGDDEILLGEWAARDLDATPGDELEIAYYRVDDRGELYEERARLEVAGIVAMTGLGADAELTPDFPGIADADSISDWEPPFPIELGRVRDQDEEYWEEYRATPKAFLSLDAGARLWASRFGRLTALRLATADEAGAERLRTELANRIPAELELQALGLELTAVKRDGLRASSGATDFGGLFLGFSLFLIVAAALLVALLFGLAVEQRAADIGLRLAVGYPLTSVRRRLLAEGLVLAVVGAVLGCLLAWVYARLLLRGIVDWWQPILGGSFLELALEPLTLGIGVTGSIAVVAGTIALGLRRLRRVPLPVLLTGAIPPATGGRASDRRPLRLALALAALSVALLLLALFGPGEPNPGLFFGLGAALSGAGFAALAASLRRPKTSLRSLGMPALLGVAARNGARNPRRSLLSVVLVGSACFVIVSVTANRHSVGAEETLEADTGSGGYSLIAESDVPLPAAAPGVDELGGFTTAGGLVSLRLRPGEDASCLNLYQPENPRLLGVPADFAEAGGFRFRSAIEPVDNPWTLLSKPLEEGVIPAIGDYNSVRWILHSKLGGEIPIDNERGEEIRLRIVGLLERSLFQSELLISESDFLEQFPGHSGFSVFLGRVPVEELRPTVEELESRLAGYGLDATTTAEKLVRFQSVENMYLTTFQILGGLGLLLGTLGLGIVLTRNVIERRGELATLRAFGYRRRSLAWMVVVETAVLLVLGVVIGAVAGAVAVAPHILRSAAEVPWRELGSILVGIVAVGLVASLLAVRGALRTPLLPTLKAE